jgi:hypothetical protein
MNHAIDDYARVENIQQQKQKEQNLNLSSG